MCSSGQSRGPRLTLLGGDGQIGRPDETRPRPLVVGSSPTVAGGIRSIVEKSLLGVFREVVSWRRARLRPPATAERKIASPSPSARLLLVKASAPAAGSVVFKAKARSLGPDDLRFDRFWQCAEFNPQ